MNARRVFPLKNKRITTCTLFSPSIPLFVLLTLISLIGFPTAGFSASSSFMAEIVAVLDGDTMKVVKARQVIIVRLHGVDAPEKAQQYGEQAKQFTERAVFGKRVVINVIGFDQNEHILAEMVLEDGRSLNRELVKAGFAWWNREQSEDLSLWRLEDKAREEKLGLWLGEDPVPPWTFRASMGHP
ncbi:MAG: thermonuclease family protein [Nitrospiria bacterium]